tara:strand:+ start:90 stop:248 length:159 start_codon:yes stop_codon:yes gene_type:complete
MKPTTQKYSEEMVKELFNDIKKKNKEIERLKFELYEVTQTAIEYSRKGIKIH